MGRILEVFPGSDGLVRVVNVKTSTGILKRAITKEPSLDGATNEIALPFGTCRVWKMPKCSPFEKKTCESDKSKLC
ncbi:hypothetical protein TNCV_3663991 [Trichonephila clavipes]|nr:hypothetical protein TNCV_3663991 [Trichonephila clavipes]